MQLADGIRKHGFRKWYERELMQSHAHLLLLFLCSIGLMTAFAAYGGEAALSQRLTDVASIALMAAVGLWSLRRYLFLLMHAEQVASQAVCMACQTYGRFRLADGTKNDQGLRVRCRKCEHEWTIAD